MEEITAYLNNHARLDEVAIEQTEGTVLLDHAGPVLATPAAVAFGTGFAVGAWAAAIG